MAFTLAHMAAALPLYRSRRWLNFEALLIGTMMPDLPYFLSQGSQASQQAHQWSGIISYCLPWGLLVFALWHWWFKAAALALIQPWYGHQSQPVNQHSAHYFIVDNSVTAHLLAKLKFALTVMAGLAIGAATHLIWDGTTHPDGFIAQRTALLQQVVILPLLGQMAIARLMQYLSSIVGLLLLLYFAYSRYQAWLAGASDLQPQGQSRARPITLSQHYYFSQSLPLSKRYSLIIIGVIAIIGLIFGLQAANKWHALFRSDHYLFLARILVSSLQGAVGVFIGYAAIYQLLSLVRAEWLRPNS